jgi:hypothetical protein
VYTFDNFLSLVYLKNNAILHYNHYVGYIFLKWKCYDVLPQSADLTWHSHYVWCGMKETVNLTTKEVSTNLLYTNTLKHGICLNNMRVFSLYLKKYKLRLHYNEE